MARVLEPLKDNKKLQVNQNITVTRENAINRLITIIKEIQLRIDSRQIFRR